MGLDCIGVVAHAFDLTLLEAPRYRLTDGDWCLVERGVAPWFNAVFGRERSNSDLAVFRLARSFHFGVVSGDDLIHADLKIGRVVARRLPARLGRECRFFEFRRGC